VDEKSRRTEGQVKGLLKRKPGCAGILERRMGRKGQVEALRALRGAHPNDVAFIQRDAAGAMKKEGSMNGQRRDFLLSVTFAAATATPVLGQAATPTLGPADSGTRSVASIPNFSGIWGHPSLGFEPPLSGPGPVVNKSRLRTGESNFNQLVGDYTNPILKPQAAEVVKQRGETSLSGVAFPDPENQCRPSGVPYIFWSFEMQMLQQPDSINILYFWDNQVRRVRMNQPHPAGVRASWYGDSVGHYEGDTLVIDSGDQGRAGFHDRPLWHAAHRGPACGGTLPAA
jgi:hypothetical protein